MKKTYHKLVRDRIPEMIAADGAASCETRHLSDTEYAQALDAKLREEVNEYLESGELEELADIEEVMRAILAANHSSYDELEKIRLKKKDERGGFEKRVFLESTAGSNAGDAPSIRTLADFTAFLEREKTVTPYKYSLIRAIIEACRQYPHYVESSKDKTRIIIPTGLCIMKWMMYYYPFFMDDRSILMNSSGGPLGFSDELKFICRYYEDGHGRLSKFRNDIVSGNIPADILPKFHDLITQIREAMLNGPICHFGGSDTGEEYTIFRKEKRAWNMKEILSLKDLIERCGSFSMPAELWSIFMKYGGYVLGNETVMEKWLDFLVKYNPEIARDELLVRLSTLPVDERMVDDAREVYGIMVNNGLVCIWDNKTKLKMKDGDQNAKMEVDHLIPFSIWKSNALWNLLPACKTMNLEKLDQIPSRRLLELRKERIFVCWDALYAAYPSKFENEIATDLLKGEFPKDWREQAFQRICRLSDYLITECKCMCWDGPKQS